MSRETSHSTLRVAGGVLSVGAQGREAEAYRAAEHPYNNERRRRRNVRFMRCEEMMFAAAKLSSQKMAGNTHP